MRFLEPGMNCWQILPWCHKYPLSDWDQTMQGNLLLALIWSWRVLRHYIPSHQSFIMFTSPCLIAFHDWCTLFITHFQFSTIGFGEDNASFDQLHRLFSKCDRVLFGTWLGDWMWSEYWPNGGKTNFFSCREVPCSLSLSSQNRSTLLFACYTSCVDLLAFWVVGIYCCKISPSYHSTIIMKDGNIEWGWH